MTLRVAWMTTLLVSVSILCHAPVTTATTTSSTAADINTTDTSTKEVIATTTIANVTDVPDMNNSSPMSESTGSSSTTGTNTENTTSPFPDTSTTDDHNNNNTDHGDTRSPHSNGITLFPFEFKHVKHPLILTLVVIIAAMSKLVYHNSHFLSTKFPESCVLIVIGVVIGIILYFSGLYSSIQLYEPHEFFLYLLPPIILEAAFSLHDRVFAENLGSVLLFAVLGTVLNCFIIGFSLYGLYQAGVMEEINCSLVQILVFSALIVAVDPVAVLAVFQEVGVNSTLYYLVFGESLLNDGVTVVLYDVMQIFNTMSTEITGVQMLLGVVKFCIVVVLGTLVGATCGLLSSFITKFTNSVKVVEPLVVFGFAYLSFMISEVFEFSGIISIIACGILQAHYAFHNVTKKSLFAIKFLAKVMASANEIIIFMFLGLITVSSLHDWKTGFALWTTLLCVVTRFLVTFSLSMVVNACSSDVRKIKLDEMFMISYGGLRGAVCFSLVALINEEEIPKKNMFVTTTLFVIFFTVFIQGGSIKWLVEKMRVARADVKEDMKLNEELATHVFDHIMAGVEEIVGYTHGSYHIKMRLDQIDNRVLRPVLLKNATHTHVNEISNYYEKLIMKEHYRNLHLGDTKLRGVQTNIRNLDSELVLEKLDQDDDENENEVDDSRGERLSSSEQRQMERNRTFGDSLHNVLSNTIHSVRSQLHIKVHDSNLSHDKRHSLIAFLRKKHRRNKHLSELRTSGEHGHTAGTSNTLSELRQSVEHNHTEGNSDNLAAQIHELPVDTGVRDRKTSQVRFDTIDIDETTDDSNGSSDGRVTFHL